MSGFVSVHVVVSLFDSQPISATRLRSVVARVQRDHNLIVAVPYAV